MAVLIDTSVWVDFLHPRTPNRIRESARAEIAAEDAVTCEPVLFELLRACPSARRESTEAFLATLPVLPTPASLWRDAADLGRRVQQAGETVAAMDLLIAAVALHHRVEVATFDGDFAVIARAASLQVRMLARK